MQQLSCSLSGDVSFISVVPLSGSDVVRNFNFVFDCTIVDPWQTQLWVYDLMHDRSNKMYGNVGGQPNINSSTWFAHHDLLTFLALTAEKNSRYRLLFSWNFPWGTRPKFRLGIQLGPVTPPPPPPHHHPFGPNQRVMDNVAAAIYSYRNVFISKISCKQNKQYT